MIVLPRNEVTRMRISSIFSVILGLAVLIGVIRTPSDSSELVRAGLLLIGAIAVAALVLALFHLFTRRRTSRAILFRQGDLTVIATNQLHDGFKLRFFRDVLGENMVSFSDEERERWSVLEKEGFHPIFNVRNLRKTYLLSLCFMVFEEVFVFDHTNHWDYFDCRNTSEPTFPERGVGPFRDDSIMPLIKGERAAKTIQAARHQAS